MVSRNVGVSQAVVRHRRYRYQRQSHQAPRLSGTRKGVTPRYPLGADSLSFRYGGDILVSPSAEAYHDDTIRGHGRRPCLLTW